MGTLDIFSFRSFEFVVHGRTIFHRSNKFLSFVLNINVHFPSVSFVFSLNNRSVKLFKVIVAGIEIFGLALSPSCSIKLDIHRNHMNAFCSFNLNFVFSKILGKYENVVFFVKNSRNLRNKYFKSNTRII